MEPNTACQKNEGVHTSVIFCLKECGETLCNNVCFANAFWPQRWIKKASGLTLDERQNSVCKCLTCVHFVFSTAKEEENTPESVHSITDDVKGGCSDDDFDISTPFCKGNNTVINFYIDVCNSDPKLGLK